MAELAPVEIEHIRGPHPGWNRYNFDHRGKPWSLLTIDADQYERSHSLLSLESEEKKEPWPRHHIKRIDGIISPQAAVVIINTVFESYNLGIERGKAIKLQEVQKVLLP